MSAQVRDDQVVWHKEDKVTGVPPSGRRSLKRNAPNVSFLCSDTADSPPRSAWERFASRFGRFRTRSRDATHGQAQPSPGRE